MTEEDYLQMEKWDDRFLDMAELVGSWSKDPSTKVGAVIVDKQRRVVGVGYNGFARGVHDEAGRLETREIKYEMVVHAEVNAIMNSARSLEGCTLYVSPLPCCSRCAAIVIQSGISRVVSRCKSDGNISAWSHSASLAKLQFIEAGVKTMEVIT